MWSLTTLSLCVSSSVWTTYRATNGSTLRFHFRAFTPSYPFQHALWWDIWSPSCLNFILFWPRGRCLAYNSTNFPSLLIIFPNFLHNISYTTWTTPSLNCRHPFMCLHTSHWPYGYPPFTLCSWQWTHWNPWCNSWHLCHHCMRCWFSCGMKITTCAFYNHIQLLLSTNQHCAYQRWHLHLSKRCHCRPNVSGFTSLILRNSRIAAFNVAQAKEMNYHNRHRTDQLFPLTIEVFCYLHKHANVFLHDCANAIWSLKGTEGLNFLPLSFFSVNFFWFHYKKMQASSILNWAIAVGLATFWLPPFQNTPPITMVDLL
jgi:hypothetical protein